MAKSFPDSFDANFINLLKERSIKPGGFDFDLDGRPSSTFRRQAWLYLLRVPHGPLREIGINGQTSATSSIRENPRLEDAKPKECPAASPSSFPHEERRTATNSEVSDLVTDQDGCLIRPKDLLEGDKVEDYHKTTVETGEQEWETIASKKNRRRRRAVVANQEPLEDMLQELNLEPNKVMPSSSSTIHDVPHSSNPRSGISSRDRSAKVNLPDEPSSSKEEEAKFKGVNSVNAQSSGIWKDWGSRSMRGHRDEEQVDKDVLRSFVGPAFRSDGTRESLSSRAATILSTARHVKDARRKQLEEVVIGTLRTYPNLSYFQGYHDIISVLLLTLSPSTPPSASIEPSSHSSYWPNTEERDLAHQAARRISLHFVRDSMTDDLNAIMGHLKILRRIVMSMDQDLALLSDRASPVPFFAISWILTLLSHDMDSFESTLRIFDFLISHGPSSILYLSAAIILSKERELKSLDDEEKWDPSMLHVILSRLPKIYDDSPSVESPESKDGVSEGRDIKQGEEITLGNEDPTSEISKESGLRRRKKKGKRRRKAARERIFQDPDVYPPGDQTMDRAESTSPMSSSSDHSAPSDDGKVTEKVGSASPEEMGLPLSSLLLKASELERMIPLSSKAVAAHEIMGKRSVLFTWREIFSDAGVGSPASTLGDGKPEKEQPSADVGHGPDWESLDKLANEYVKHVEEIVLDPHPESTAIDEEDGKEGLKSSRGGNRGNRGKVSLLRSIRYRLSANFSGDEAGGKGDFKGKELVLGTTIAVVGVAGVLMALYANGEGASPFSGNSGMESAFSSGGVLTLRGAIGVAGRIVGALGDMVGPGA